MDGRKVLVAKENGRYVVRLRPREEIEAAVAADYAVPEVGPLDRLWYGLSKYSLSVDIARGIAAKAREELGGPGGSGATKPDRIYKPDLWQRGERFSYTDNPYAARNRAALREMKVYADRLGVPLFLLLIPPKEHAADTGYYDELKAALRAMGIGFADVAERFDRNGRGWWELYWPQDAHLGPNGNEVVGNFLAEQVGPLLHQTISAR